jgi:ribonuclease R
VPLERNDAHRMIEEFMVAANVAAAEFLLEHKIPALYRIHAGPTVEKLADLRAFLAELGLSLGGGEQPQPKHYAKLLESVRGRPDTRLIQTVLLRSLSQAVYSPDNSGHFGLAYEAYTHFTSPIRRFPDLLVHRAIRHLLARKRLAAFAHTHADMASAGEHCSMTERRADEATRDAVDWLKCEYMQDKVGEVFDGLITGVTSFGLFVELRDVYVEGLLHISSLGKDYYHFNPAKHQLLGERTKTAYRLADAIAVRVVRVDLDERKIDFELVEEAPRAKKRKRAKR